MGTLSRPVAIVKRCSSVIAFLLLIVFPSALDSANAKGRKLARYATIIPPFGAPGKLGPGQPSPAGLPPDGVWQFTRRGLICHLI